MWDIILVRVIIIAFSIFCFLLYGQEILQIIINLPLLYIVGVRSYVEIHKEKKTKQYLISLGITSLIFLIIFGIAKLSYNIIVWWPTVFLIVMYLIAHLIMFLKSK